MADSTLTQPQQPPRNPARLDPLWVLLGAVLLMVITCLPYLSALQMTPPHSRFMGLLWGVDEGNVYLQWMRQARDGAVVFRNQFTSMPQNPHYFNGFFLLAGWAARLSGLPLIVIYHLARVFGGIFLILAFYKLVCEITARRAVQLGAVAFAALSSGLGWILVLQAQAATGQYRPPALPVDVALNWQAQPEAIGFVSLLLNPLFVVSMGLLCLVMLYGMRAMTRGWGSVVACGVCLLLLGNIHTYDVFVCVATLFVWFAAWAVTRRVRWWDAALRYAVVALICLPGPLWAWHTAHVDPAYKAKIDTITASAWPLDYLVSYGIPLLLALLGVIYALRRRPRSQGLGLRAPLEGLLFPVIWLALNAVLLYTPVSFQRKLIEGMHLPICILAAAGAVWLIADPLRKLVSPALVLSALVVISLPSNAIFVSECLRHARVNNLDLLAVLQPPMYLSDDDIGALRYLAGHSGERDLVICSSLVGSHIPAAAPCTVFAGHWAETLNFNRAIGTLSLFYRPGQDVATRRQILRETGATLVYYGPEERLFQQALARLPSAPSAAAGDLSRGLPELQRVFANAGVTIYRVRQVGARA